MIKDFDPLFYINIVLFLLIIINIIIIVMRERKRREFFEDASPSTDIIKVNTRPCTLHLTNDDELCNRMADIYKMSDLQIQVILNKIQYEGNMSTYSLLQFVKDNKKTLPINACKIELNKFKEVNNLYLSTSSNLYKNIYRDISYNNSTLSGYCLSDISEYSSFNTSNIINIVNPTLSSNIFFNAQLDSPTNVYDENNSRYLALKVRNKINRDVLLNDMPYVCSELKTPIEDKLQFIRLHCALYDTSRLVVDNIDFVNYDANSRKMQIVSDTRPSIMTTIPFIQSEPEIMQYNSSNILNTMFSYIYDKKQIKYVPINKQVFIYKFTHNFCNKIEEFTMYDNIQFSLAELNVQPTIIKYNIDLSPIISNSNVIDNNIPTAVNNKLSSILISNNNNIRSIDDHTSNQILLNAMYAKLREETCPALVNNKDKALCTLRTNAIQDEYNIHEIEKYSLQEKLQNQRVVYYELLETKKRIDNTSFTIADIKDIVSVKVPITYSKYADMISNDDCLYIQI
jgi:hypothetical protein